MDAEPDRRLTNADIEAIAQRVAELVRAPLDRSLVSAQTLGRLLDLEARWVREHARELGGVQLGNGPKARWRFDPIEARERLMALREPAPVCPPVQRVMLQARSEDGFPPVQGPRPIGPRSRSWPR
jgi:hypothetical protein